MPYGCCRGKNVAVGRCSLARGGDEYHTPPCIRGAFTSIADGMRSWHIVFYAIKSYHTTGSHTT